jgi:hypothetical protein
VKPIIKTSLLSLLAFVFILPAVQAKTFYFKVGENDYRGYDIGIQIKKNSILIKDADVFACMTETNLDVPEVEISKNKPKKEGNSAGGNIANVITIPVGIISDIETYKINEELELQIFFGLAIFIPVSSYKIYKTCGKNKILIATSRKPRPDKNDSALVSISDAADLCELEES